MHAGLAALVLDPARIMQGVRHVGPAALELAHHALAPVARLPVLEVISGTHLVTDMTLGMGRVIHDYLA